jgi:hypothetical protein
MNSKIPKLTKWQIKLAAEWVRILNDALPIFSKAKSQNETARLAQTSGATLCRLFRRTYQIAGSRLFHLTYAQKCILLLKSPLHALAIAEYSKDWKFFWQSQT